MNKDITRVLSAIVMILLVIGLVSLGNEIAFCVIVFVGCLVFDELLSNFLAFSRQDKKYYLFET